VLLGNIKNDQSLNRFAYVDGQPISNVDPFGLCGDSDQSYQQIQLADDEDPEEDISDWDQNLEAMGEAEQEIQQEQANSPYPTYDPNCPQPPVQPESVDQSVNAVPAAPNLDFTPIEQNNEAENPLANIQYTDKVKEQMASGDYHSFPEGVDAFGADGTITTITGGDSIERTEVEIPGSYQGKEGVFQYIIEPDGVTCNHRLFVPN
jgi:hypothetical protein